MTLLTQSSNPSGRAIAGVIVGPERVVRSDPVHIPQSASGVGFQTPRVDAPLESEQVWARVLREAGKIFVRRKLQAQVIEHQIGDATLDVDAIATRRLTTIAKARMTDDDIIASDDERSALEPDAVAGRSLSRDGHFGFGDARFVDRDVAAYTKRDRATFGRNSSQRFRK